MTDIIMTISKCLSLSWNYDDMTEVDITMTLKGHNNDNITEIS